MKLEAAAGMKLKYYGNEQCPQKSQAGEADFITAVSACAFPGSSRP